VDQRRRSQRERATANQPARLSRVAGGSTGSEHWQHEFNEVKLRGGGPRTGNRPRYGDRRWLNAGTVIGGPAHLVTPGGGACSATRNIKPETQTSFEAGTDIQLLRIGCAEGPGTTARSRNLAQPATFLRPASRNLTINGGRAAQTGPRAGADAFPRQQATWISDPRHVAKNPQTIEESSFGSVPSTWLVRRRVRRNFISRAGEPRG